MKKLILLFIIFFINCTHNIPIAKIEFEKIENNNKKNNSYYLYFNSDNELIDSFNEYSYSSLDCFFLDKQISKEDYIKNQGYTLTSVGKMQLIKKDSLYHYKATVFFYNDIDDSIGNRRRAKEVKKEIENHSGCLSCAITAVTMLELKKRYISKTMCLSKKEVRKVLK